MHRLTRSMIIQKRFHHSTQLLNAGKQIVHSHNNHLILMTQKFYENLINQFPPKTYIFEPMSRNALLLVHGPAMTKNLIICTKPHTK